MDRRHPARVEPLVDPRQLHRPRQAQRAALDQQIAETKDRERGEAIAKVRALMSEWPVLYMSGTPPASRIAGARRCEHLTS